MTHRKVFLVSALAGVALVTGGWLLQRDAGPQGTVYQQARLFDDVLSRVADFYVDSIDERKLYQMAIDEPARPAAGPVLDFPEAG
jgi:hypothetical protein